MEQILILALLVIVSIAVEAARKSREKRNREMRPGRPQTRAASGAPMAPRADPRRAPPPVAERELPEVMRQLQEALFGQGREAPRARPEFLEEEELEIIEEPVAAPSRRKGRRESPLKRLERALTFGEEDATSRSEAAAALPRESAGMARLELVLSRARGPLARAILASEVLGPPVALRATAETGRG